MGRFGLRVGVFGLSLVVLLGLVADGERALVARTPVLMLVSLGGPHRVRRGRGRMSLALRRVVDRRALGVGSAEDAIRLALLVADTQLTFGLGHRRRLRFGGVRRAAHCVELAELVAAVLGRVSRRVGLGLEVRVVRSSAPRVLGLRIPHAAWRDHDWVLVRGPRGRRWCVDPSLASVGGGWAIDGRVVGRGAKALCQAAQ